MQADNSSKPPGHSQGQLEQTCWSPAVWLQHANIVTLLHRRRARPALPLPGPGVYLVGQLAMTAVLKSTK